MEFFNQNTCIDFMRQKTYAMIFSILLAFASCISIAYYGLNLGLDFTGGTQIELMSTQSIEVEALRHRLEANGFPDASVQLYGTAQHAMVRVAEHPHLAQAQLRSRIQQAAPDCRILKLEFIGPQVGQTLLNNGILAIIVSMLATMAYIAVRFDYRFAVSAAVSLIHDPVLILGVFAYFQLEFNLVSLAALLTILGYSLNDTIVVYDRIRENFRLFHKKSPTEIVNLSINQTLSRTIMTSGLTLLVVLALCLLGGETLRGFSVALIVGIVIGTYSSIYVAGALSVVLGLDRKALLNPSKSTQTLQV
ncbi:MAG: protein translocase subunit SecF [Legionellales bacterium]|nr:protein translocase subunit SecF [Legionellales bacterium]|tara:strand:- start:1887 stop:2804 length:918 start_codon:yes stop_codon:yes gene_type:complete